MTELRACAHCGTAEGELTEFNGRLYCPDCLDDLTLVCTDCGSRFLRAHNRSENDDFPICPECYDRDYTRCVRCGRIIDTDNCWYPLDNDDPYCADCCSTIENSPIHDYYFKPYPIFYGDGPRYFGVELEIDDGGECDSSAEALMDIANQSKTLAYCKHDGSLDDGFEIVTHPMSLDCQLHEMPWAEVLRFSRRTQRQLEQWAARYGYRDRPGEMLEHVKKGHGGRYTCVNLTNADTIEFRMLRGTLKLNTLIATLQLVDHICDAAIFMSDDELHDLSWSSFVSAIKEPELVQYLKERNLYINEPVEVEGEV